MSSVWRFLRNIGSLVVESFREWRRDGALDLGAALAYYTVFSIAPVIVIVTAVAGLAFGREAAQGEIVAQFRGLMGEDGARVIESVIRSAHRPTTGTIATLVGFAALLIGASGVFGQLQASLNRIWNVGSPPGGLRTLLKRRLLSFAMVLGVGFLLLVSLVVSALLAAVGAWMSSWFGSVALLMRIFGSLFSFTVITVLFALMFKVLPDARIAWGDVWIGAAITALLFTLGKALIGFYVVHAGVGMAYGVAGSILVVLVWIYYSAQIFFFGAELTQVYAERYGSKIQERRSRRRVEDAAAAQVGGVPRPATGPGV